MISFTVQSTEVWKLDAMLKLKIEEFEANFMGQCAQLKIMIIKDEMLSCEKQLVDLLFSIIDESKIIFSELKTESNINLMIKILHDHFGDVHDFNTLEVHLLKLLRAIDSQNALKFIQELIELGGVRDIEHTLFQISRIATLLPQDQEVVEKSVYSGEVASKFEGLQKLISGTKFEELMAKSRELLLEALTKLEFSDEEKKQLIEIVDKIKINHENSMREKLISVSILVPKLLERFLEIAKQKKPLERFRRNSYEENEFTRAIQLSNELSYFKDEDLEKAIQLSMETYKTELSFSRNQTSDQALNDDHKQEETINANFTSGTTEKKCQFK